MLGMSKLHSTPRLGEHFTLLPKAQLGLEFSVVLDLMTIAVQVGRSDVEKCVWVLAESACLIIAGTCVTLVEPLALEYDPQW